MATSDERFPLQEKAVVSNDNEGRLRKHADGEGKHDTMDITSRILVQKVSELLHCLMRPENRLNCGPATHNCELIHAALILVPYCASPGYAAPTWEAISRRSVGQGPECGRWSP